MNKIETKLIELREVKCKAAVFRGMSEPFINSSIVVGRDDMESEEFESRYGFGARKADAFLQIGSPWRFRHFAVWMESGYDPAVAVVEADDELNALEDAVSELNWFAITEEDAADLPEEVVGCSDSGTLYNSELMRVVELQLLATEYI